MACVHRYAREEKKIWSLIALAIGIVYATMATINYQIQLVSVQHSLLSGRTEGMEMFVQSSPRSIFVALATSYVYMCVAMVFAAPLFEGGLSGGCGGSSSPWPPWRSPSLPGACST